MNIKIFATTAEINLEDAIPVFHRWIQDSVVPELMIDVADYKHVPDGPGIMLIGYEADYSLDVAAGRLGLLYNRKKKGDRTPQDALRQAYSAAVNACKLLEEEPEFGGNLMFDYNTVQVILNDRLLYPNDDQTWVKVKPELAHFFDEAFGEGAYTLERVGEPRDRFMVSADKN